MIETGTIPRVNRRVFWLRLTLIAGMLIYTVVELGYRFILPTDGWLVTEDGNPGLTYLANILGENAALRTGDRVIFVDETPVDYDVFLQTASIRQAWRFGATLDYTVVRDGQELVVPVTLTRWRFAPFVTNRLLDPAQLIGLLADLVLFVIAAAVALRRPDNQAAFPFLVVITFFMLTSWSETLPFGFPVWTDTLAHFFQDKVSLFLLVVLFPTALVQFALVFPRPKPIQQRFPWLSAVVPVTATVLLLLTFASAIAWYWFLFSMFLGLSIMVHNGFTMRDPVSRAQIRWGAGGMLIGIGALAVSMTVSTFGLVDVPEWWWDLVSTFATTIIGVMISIAITRYRLFDIDIIIRRTLQYTLLTGSLALVYFGSVVVLQTVLGRLVGEESPLVIVLSTLLIAALFTPLRRRVQAFIDRRFYRRKVDAARVLAGFTATARDEVALERLETAMLDAVQRSLEPATSAIWLVRRQSNEPPGS